MPTPTDSLTYEKLSAQLAEVQATQLVTLRQGIEHLSALDPDSTIAIRTRHLHELLRGVLRSWECLSERDQLLLSPIDFETFDAVSASTFGRLSIILETQLRHASGIVNSTCTSPLHSDRPPSPRSLRAGFAPPPMRKES